VSSQRPPSRRSCGGRLLLLLAVVISPTPPALLPLPSPRTCWVDWRLLLRVRLLPRLLPRLLRQQESKVGSPITNVTGPGAGGPSRVGEEGVGAFVGAAPGAAGAVNARGAFLCFAVMAA